MARPTKSPTRACSWPATTRPTSTARPSPSTAGSPPRTRWCAASGEPSAMIYLVRHGETAFYRERRIQGHVDSPLTELGLRQARAVGRLLRDLIRDPAGWRVISSPLGRAKATADIVAAKLGGLPVELDDR